MVFLFCLVLSLFLTGMEAGEEDSVVRANGERAQKGFYRAFWVQAFEPGLKTPEEIDQLVADVEAANMNAIIAQVSRRHDAYYESEVLPFTEDPAVPEGFDPLDYLLSAAHEKNIEVHAWVVVGPMWHPIYGGPPQDESHIWHTYGPDAPDDETWVTKGYDGSIGNRLQPYLDLGNPEAVDHVVEMVTDIVKNYDVDGVHLDYIRCPENPGGKPPGWNGYNPTALERFLAETGRTAVPEPGDAEWLAWKVKQVDNALKRIYLEMMAVDVEARLTAAVVSWGYDDPRSTDWWTMDPIQRAHQDWKKWVQEGYLDFAFVMNYDSDADPVRAKRFDAWTEWEKDLPRNRGIVIGPALYMNTIPDSISQIHRALAPSPQGNTADGVSPYVYNEWSSDGKPREDLIRSLSQATGWNDGKPPFFEPIGVPEAPWKQAPYGHLLGQAVNQDGQALSDVRIVLRRGKQGSVVADTVTDGNGYFGVTDLRPGHYFMEMDRARHRPDRVRVLPGEVTRIQLDRSMQE